MKDFFSKCDQIRSKLRIWSHILKKFLMENLIFLCSVGHFQRDGYVLPYGSSFLTFRFTFKYILARHSSHHNVIFFIPFLFFKTWRQKAMSILKKSSVKWKCEKQIVYNYLVTGNLEKMY